MEGGVETGGEGRGRGRVHRDHGLSLYTTGTFLYCPWKFLLGEKVGKVSILFILFPFQTTNNLLRPPFIRLMRSEAESYFYQLPL